MKLFSLSLLLVFIAASGYPQTDYLISEQFNDNRNNWSLENKNGTKSYISGGKMYMQCSNSYASYRFWIYSPINTKGDFEIEAKFSKLSGNSDNFNGIVWGASGWDNSYNFEISESGYFQIWYYKKERQYFIKNKTKSSKINQRGTNLLKIEKKGKKLNFYINGAFVHSATFQDFFGRFNGFIVESNSKIAADFINIKQEKRKIITLSKNISKYNKENLGLNINSPYSEIAPVIAPDGKTLYIARSKHPLNYGAKDKFDIWYSELQADGSWGKLKHAPKPLNNTGDNVVIAASADNNALMLENLYNSDGSFKSEQGISVSFRTATGWSVPRELKIQNYYNRNQYESFCPSADRKVLIMSVERDEGYGKKDLYVSFLRADGSYGKPQNMGSVLNSYDDEGTPYLSPDNKTLYFYSYTEAGYGSADIFVSKRLDDSWMNWSQPKNLGSKINSPEWDVYYTVDAKGDYAYLVSSEKSYGNEDIFRIKLRDDEKPEPVVMLTGKVLDKKTGKPIGTNIVYEDNKTGKTAGIARSNPSDGSYKIVLPYGTAYNIRAVKVNYFALSEYFDLRNVEDYKEIERNLLLSPIEKEETIILKNVNFYAAKARLLPESYPELKRLAKLMQANPNMIIELHGHTEATDGYEEELMALSHRRIKSVKAYLVNKGISEERIKEKAFGGSRPIADNTTKEGRKANRRVEFKILAQ
jgi:outer membrane protein OmpA-like peptidoglycan-associated protein